MMPTMTTAWLNQQVLHIYNQHKWERKSENINFMGHYRETVFNNITNKKEVQI